MLIDRWLLEWFLTKGVTEFHGSTMGVALEAASMNALVIPPPTVVGKRRKHPNVCGACGAPAMHETCDECGYSVALKRVRYTAEITAERRTKNVPIPEDQSLIRHAWASQRKSFIMSVGKVYWLALEAYHGDVGAGYMGAAYKPYNELIAVMPLTEAGQWLNKKALEDDNNPAMSDAERIRFLIAKGAKNGKHAKRISDAAGDANALYTEAVGLWNAASEAARKRDGA